MQRAIPIRIRVSVLALLCALATGCASPGPPRAPSLHLPRAVHDLSAERVGSTVTLHWTMPSETTDALPIKVQTKVVLCRHIGNRPCETVQSAMESPGAPATMADVLPQELLLNAPQLLTYELRAITAAGRDAGPSNSAYAATGATPEAVSSLSATVVEQGVVLHWEQTTISATGQQMRVHRELVPSSAKKEAAPRKTFNPLAPEKKTETAAELRVHGDEGGTLDAEAQFGASYIYTVQRARELTFDSHSVLILGPPSTLKPLQVRDVFPPHAPQGLAVAPSLESETVHAADLSWEPNNESDLAEYVVYRRDGESGSGWKLLGHVPAPSFHDTGLVTGRTYSYSVSAVDKSGNESKRSDVADLFVPQH